MDLFENLRPCSSTDRYVPKCCADHRSHLPKGKNIDTTRWKFPQPRIPAQKISLPSQMEVTASKRELDRKQIDSMLEDIKTDEFIKMLSSCLDPKSAENVADVLGIKLPAKTKDERKLGLASIDRPSSVERHTRRPDTLGQVWDIVKAEEGESAKGETKGSDNMYFSLLRQIEKSEREKKEADPDALAYKLVEERLDELANEFCSWTSCLLLPATGENANSFSERSSQSAEMAISPEKLRELFHIELCQSSLCPYIPYIIQEAREQPKQAHERIKAQALKSASVTEKEEMPKSKQAYYIPPSQWFGKKEKVDAFTLKRDEEDFIKSFAFKQFMKFLDERGEQPPKVFSDLKSRHREQMMRIRAKENAFRRT